MLDGGQFAGLLAFRCVSSVPRDQWDTRSVRSCMIAAVEVPRLRRGQAAVDALTELSASAVNRGVVVEDGRVVGILSAAELGRALDAGPRRRPVSRSVEHAAVGGHRSRWA